MISTNASESGFTLLEVLVVVFILGLTSGFIVMSLPERASGLQAEVIGLETNFKQIQKRAVLTGYVYALDLNETSYQVMRRQAGEWVPAANLTHDFPPAVVADVPDQKMGETGWRFLFYPAGVPDPVRVILIGKNERRDVSHQASRALER